MILGSLVSPVRHPGPRRILGQVNPRLQRAEAHDSRLGEGKFQRQCFVDPNGGCGQPRGGCDKSTKIRSLSDNPLESRAITQPCRNCVGCGVRVADQSVRDAAGPSTADLSAQNMARVCGGSTKHSSATGTRSAGRNAGRAGHRWRQATTTSATISLPLVSGPTRTARAKLAAAPMVPTSMGTTYP
jgi:hypothetical protein